jgi:uncharacterized protein YmfQ (DUF2313 family)
MAYNSNLEKLISALSDELQRIEIRTKDLITERDPRETSELITEFEKELAIPEEGLSLGATYIERRNEIYAKLLTLGGQDKPYYTDLINNLGYKIYIGEYTPSWVGSFLCGDPVQIQDMIYYFVVGILPNPSINLLEALVVMINKYKPAHSRALFSFFGAEFDRAFGDGFYGIQEGGENYWGGAFNLGFNSAYDVNLDTVLPEEVSNGGSFGWAFSTDFNGFHYVITP